MASPASQRSRVSDGAVSARAVANWITGELFALLNETGLPIEECPLPASALAAVVALRQSGRINLPTAKHLLAEILGAGGDPAQLVEERGLAQLTDPGEIDRLVLEVERNHPVQVAQYLEGKKTIEQWLFGQVMRAASGKADPQLVQRRLRLRLALLEKNQRRFYGLCGPDQENEQSGGHGAHQ